MSTGTVSFGGGRARSGDQEPLNIVVLGDFSGAGNNTETLRALTVDRDNFDDIFAKIAPALKIPGSEDLLTFTDLDELHPDFLYRESALFAHLRRLKSGLKNPAKVERVTQEILSWTDASTTVAGGTAQATNSTDSGTPLSLDSLLEQNNQDASAANDIAAFIKSVVSPHMSAKQTPQQNQLSQTLSQVCSTLMVEVLQWPAFKVLEANWRSLYWLTRQLETGPQLTLSLVDVNMAQLQQGLTDEQPNSLTKLSALLSENPLFAQGQGYDLILGNYQFGDNLAELAVLEQLSGIAATNNALFISGGHEHLAGCASLRRSADPDDWDYTLAAEPAAAWQQLRQKPAFAHCILTCPRFLLRLPYGKKTAPIETFAFEEWSDSSDGKHYLWGNGAHLLAAGIAQQRYNNDADSIGDLPIHYFQRDGDSEMQPCLEAALGDRARGQLQAQGLSPLALASPDRVLVVIPV